MNGIEALRAMREGKTVRYRNNIGCRAEYRFCNKRVQVRTGDRWEDTCLGADFFVNAGDDFEVVCEKTYPMSFVDAVNALFDGKAVESNESDARYRIVDGRLCIFIDDYSGTTRFGYGAVDRLWRVVE